MKSFFEEGVYEEICVRVDQLLENSSPHWGKMNAAQMLHHCQIPLNIILEHEDYDLKPNWLINVLFKKSMYSDTPWKKNLPTARGFKVNDDRDFKIEKQKLLELLGELNERRHQINWPLHPSFGKFSKEQWGKCNTNTWIITSDNSVFNELPTKTPPGRKSGAYGRGNETLSAGDGYFCEGSYTSNNASPPDL
jgi:hypothetical protein